MYARYIPPKKTVPVAAPSPAPPARAFHSNAPPPPQARYAPPAAVQPPPPPQKRKIVFDDDDDVVAAPFQPAVISAVEDTTPDRAVKRLKKQSTGGKEKEEKNDEEVAPTTAADDAEDKKGKKRKRRNKKAGKEKEGEEKEGEEKVGEGKEGEEKEELKAGTEEQKTADEDVVMESPLPEKEKKRKRRRKSKAANEPEEAEEKAERPAKEEPVEEPAEEPAEESPKKKAKEKLKKKAKEKLKKKTATSEEPAAEEADEMPARFKALLEKKDKSLKRAKKQVVEADEAGEADEADEADEATPAELHGLEPLPQPAPVASSGAAKLAYDTLPRWLLEPVRVSAETRATFAQLGVDDGQVERVLREKGWTDAFAVQTAVIPMLLPSRQQRRGDLVISAATGSGKTLAYVLPLVRDLCHGGGGASAAAAATTTRPRLRAVIVVPTRELVQQVHDVCETCARAFSASAAAAANGGGGGGGGGGRRRLLRIGVAMGSQSLRREQAALVDEEQTYDPAGYRAALRQRQKWPLVVRGDSAEYGSGFGLLPNISTLLPDHVVRHVSAVDVLVTTPGRLVEHLRATPGFALDHVRWLVVDEADKLLGQSYQQWLGVVTAALDRPGPAGARDFADASSESGVRKVVLSATMTRDLGLLDSLRLSRPRHVVLEGSTRQDGEGDGGGGSGGGGGDGGAAEYVLPRLLRESAIKVRDEAQKPLYLVDLLNDSRLMEVINERGGEVVADGGSEESEDDSESSESSESEDSSDSDDSSNSDDSADTDKPKSKSKSRGFATTALIFTRSNENALRLSRLLSLLLVAPRLAGLVGTITSTTRTSERRKTLRAFAAGRLRILVATDLAARGIDLPRLGHVINYDMPPSVEFYVHRVGRTARAGRAGHAWTLFSKKEAGWFWPEVAGQGGGKPGRMTTAVVVRRSGKVAKVVLGGGDEEEDDDNEDDNEDKTLVGPGGRFSEARIAAYEAALEQLGKEAAASERSRGAAGRKA